MPSAKQRRTRSAQQPSPRRTLRALCACFVAGSAFVATLARAQPTALEPLPADVLLVLNLDEQGDALVLDLRLSHASGRLACREPALIAAHTGGLISISVLGLKALPLDHPCRLTKEPGPQAARVQLPRSAGSYELELVAAGVRDRYRLRFDAETVNLTLEGTAALTRAKTVGALRRFPRNLLLVSLEWTAQPSVDAFAAERALLDQRLRALGAEPSLEAGRFLLKGAAQELPVQPDGHDVFQQRAKLLYRYAGPAEALSNLVAEFARYHRVPAPGRPSLALWLIRRDSVASTYAAFR